MRLPIFLPLPNILQFPPPPLRRLGTDMRRMQAIDLDVLAEELERVRPEVASRGQQVREGRVVGEGVDESATGEGGESALGSRGVSGASLLAREGNVRLLTSVM